MCFSKVIRFVVAQFIAPCVSPEVVLFKIGLRHLLDKRSVSATSVRVVPWFRIILGQRCKNDITFLHNLGLPI